MERQDGNWMDVGMPLETESDEERRKNVLLFGTSGNPPTGRSGHSGVVEYFVDTGRYEEVWVLPVYQHMFKSKRDNMSVSGSATFNQRVDMCRLSFEWHSTNACRVRVLRTEEEVFHEKLKSCGEGKDPSELRVGTYDVVQHLSREHPDVNFSFLLGTDTYQDLRRGMWRDSKELLECLTFVVVDRHGATSTCEEVPQEVIVHHIPELTDISSTSLREATKEEVLTVDTSIDKPVLDYIRSHRLYYYARPHGWREALAARLNPRGKRSPWVFVAAGTVAVAVVGTVAAVALTSARRGRDYRKIP